MKKTSASFEDDLCFLSFFSLFLENFSISSTLLQNFAIIQYKNPEKTLDFLNSHAFTLKNSYFLNNFSTLRINPAKAQFLCRMSGKTGQTAENGPETLRNYEIFCENPYILLKLLHDERFLKEITANEENFRFFCSSANLVSLTNATIFAKMMDLFDFDKKKLLQIVVNEAFFHELLGNFHNNMLSFLLDHEILAKMLDLDMFCLLVHYVFEVKLQKTCENCDSPAKNIENIAKTNENPAKLEEISLKLKENSQKPAENAEILLWELHYSKIFCINSLKLANHPRLSSNYYKLLVFTIIESNLFVTKLQIPDVIHENAYFSSKTRVNSRVFREINAKIKTKIESFAEKIMQSVMDTDLSDYDDFVGGLVIELVKNLPNLQKIDLEGMNFNDDFYEKLAFFIMTLYFFKRRAVDLNIRNNFRVTNVGIKYISLIYQFARVKFAMNTTVKIFNEEEEEDCKNLQENCKDLQENDNNLQENTKSFKENTRNMQENTQNMQENAKNMQENAKNIKGNSKNFKGNTKTFKENPNIIQGNTEKSQESAIRLDQLQENLQNSLEIAIIPSPLHQKPSEPLSLRTKIQQNSEIRHKLKAADEFLEKSPLSSSISPRKPLQISANTHSPSLQYPHKFQNKAFPAVIFRYMQIISKSHSQRSALILNQGLGVFLISQLKTLFPSKKFEFCYECEGRVCSKCHVFHDLSENCCRNLVFSVSAAQRCSVLRAQQSSAAETKKKSCVSRCFAGFFKGISSTFAVFLGVFRRVNEKIRSFSAKTAYFLCVKESSAAVSQKNRCFRAFFCARRLFFGDSEDFRFDAEHFKVSLNLKAVNTFLRNPAWLRIISCILLINLAICLLGPLLLANLWYSNAIFLAFSLFLLFFETFLSIRAIKLANLQGKVLRNFALLYYGGSLAGTLIKKYSFYANFVFMIENFRVGNYYISAFSLFFLTFFCGFCWFFFARAAHATFRSKLKPENYVKEFEKSFEETLVSLIKNSRSFEYSLHFSHFVNVTARVAIMVEFDCLSAVLNQFSLKNAVKMQGFYVPEVILYSFGKALLYDFPNFLIQLYLFRKLQVYDYKAVFTITLTFLSLFKSLHRVLAARSAKFHWKTIKNLEKPRKS